MNTPEGFHRIMALEVDAGFVGRSRLEFAPRA